MAGVGNTAVPLTATRDMTAITRIGTRVITIVVKSMNADMQTRGAMIVDTVHLMTESPRIHYLLLVIRASTHENTVVTCLWLRAHTLRLRVTPHEAVIEVAARETIGEITTRPIQPVRTRRRVVDMTRMMTVMGAGTNRHVDTRLTQNRGGTAAAGDARTRLRGRLLAAVIATGKVQAMAGTTRATTAETRMLASATEARVTAAEAAGGAARGGPGVLVATGGQIKVDEASGTVNVQVTRAPPRGP